MDLLHRISFWALLAIAIGYMIMLIFVSIVEPNTFYIKKYPLRFAIELFFIPTFTCIPFIAFAYFRKMKLKDSMVLLGSLWIKLFLLHILLELSGFYSWFLRD